MSERHPELLFVTGPQAGQRIRLRRPVATLGRGGNADIMLSEEYASRQQARYELLRAGPTLENLGSRGTWINGKRYKAGKKVLLETGDVIGVGSETQMLFVAAGDDPDKALQSWKDAADGRRDAFGRAPGRPMPQPVPPPQPATPEPAVRQEAQPERERRPSEMTADERADAEKQAKRRKLMTVLGVYWGLLLLGVVLAVLYLDVNPNPGIPEQPMLTGDQIAAILREGVKRTPNLAKHESALAEALGMHRQYGMNPTRLHETVVTFKEALAYGGMTIFDEPEHDRVYSNCLDTLTDLVSRRYRHAYILEKNKDWAAAEDGYRALLAIIQDEKSPIFRNVKAHHSRVKYYHEKSKPKKNPIWR